MEIFMKKNLLLLTLGYRCNNNCLFCSVSDSRMSRDTNPEKIKNEIINGSERNYKKIEFIGGEPTLYPNLIEYISLAREHDYERIAITTNGRMFSYRDFSRSIFDAGLNYVSFSLYSHEKETHEAITRTRNSFKQSLDGLRNAFKYDVETYVNTVVCKLNHSHLEEMGKFLKETGVKEWHLIDLLPEGAGEKLYKTINVKLMDLADSINKLINLNNMKIKFLDFTQCIFQKEFFNKQNMDISGVELRYRTKQETGDLSDRTRYVDGIIYDNKKILTGTCKKCLRKYQCGGLWKKYYEDYDDTEIRILAERNGYVVRSRE